MEWPRLIQDSFLVFPGPPGACGRLSYLATNWAVSNARKCRFRKTKASELSKSGVPSSNPLHSFSPAWMKRAMEPSTDDEKREMLERIRVTNEERCNIPQVDLGHSGPTLLKASSPR